MSWLVALALVLALVLGLAQPPASLDSVGVQLKETDLSLSLHDQSGFFSPFKFQMLGDQPLLGGRTRTLMVTGR